MPISFRVKKEMLVDIWYNTATKSTAIANGICITTREPIWPQTVASWVSLTKWVKEKAHSRIPYMGVVGENTAF